MKGIKSRYNYCPMCTGEKTEPVIRCKISHPKDAIQLLSAMVNLPLISIFIDESVLKDTTGNQKILSFTCRSCMYYITSPLILRKQISSSLSFQFLSKGDI